MKLNPKQKEKLLRIRQELYSITNELAKEVDAKQTHFTHAFKCGNQTLTAIEELCFDGEILDRETLEEV